MPDADSLSGCAVDIFLPKASPSHSLRLKPVMVTTVGGTSLDIRVKLTLKSCRYYLASSLRFSLERSLHHGGCDFLCADVDNVWLGVAPPISAPTMAYLGESFRWLVVEMVLYN